MQPLHFIPVWPTRDILALNLMVYSHCVKNIYTYLTFKFIFELFMGWTVIDSKDSTYHGVSKIMQMLFIV